MSGYTATPWKSTNAVRASNFGGIASRVTAMVPDPIKPGEFIGVTIAKVFGGLQEEKEVAQVNAAFIVTACNSHAELVKALEAICLRTTPHIDDDLKELQRQMHHIAALANNALATLTARKVG